MSMKKFSAAQNAATLVAALVQKLVAMPKMKRSAAPTVAITVVNHALNVAKKIVSRAENVAAAVWELHFAAHALLQESASYA